MNMNDRYKAPTHIGVEYKGQPPSKREINNAKFGPLPRPLPENVIGMQDFRHRKHEEHMEKLRQQRVQRKLSETALRNTPPEPSPTPKPRKPNGKTGDVIQLNDYR